MIQPLPDYKNLDASGEARQAALRMEARASAPASAHMFEQLVAPLLRENVHRVLEIGCGTAALSRRIGQRQPHASVYAADKSVGMLQMAQALIEKEQIGNVQLATWDVLNAPRPALAHAPFDLIISSVVIPYFTDEQIEALVLQWAQWLAPGGVLAFVEQDLNTDSVHFPDGQLPRDILAKHQRDIRPGWCLGLRPLLRRAGLTLLPRRSFLWTDQAYGLYTQEVLGRMADAARDRGAITDAQWTEWKDGLTALANAGDFYYGLVYHLIAGRRE